MRLVPLNESQEWGINKTTKTSISFILIIPASTSTTLSIKILSQSVIYFKPVIEAIVTQGAVETNS